MPLSKSETQAIIADVVKSKKPLWQALIKHGFIRRRFSYYLVKYDLKVPDYEVVKKCERCGKEFVTRKDISWTKFCPECQSPMQKATKRWQKRNGGWVRKTRVRHKIREKTNYPEMSDGWFYNEKITEEHKSICQKCGGKNKDLNRWGFCFMCYENGSDELASPNEPYYCSGRFPQPISEMTIKTIVTPKMEG